METAKVPQVFFFRVEVRLGGWNRREQEVVKIFSWLTCSPGPAQMVCSQWTAAGDGGWGTGMS